MTIVKINIVVLFFFILSCKSPIKKEDLFDNSKTEQDSFFDKNYENIQINSLKDDFDGDLINTLSVKKTDTVLFRKWDAGNKDSVFFKKQKIVYKLKKNTFVNYYKSGGNKFSIYDLFLSNIKTKKTIKFSTYVNKFEYPNPYDNNNISGYVDLKKISENKVKLIISDSYADEYFLLLEIKNESIQIINLERSPLSTNTTPYKHKLDTLITLKNNDLINLIELGNALIKEKNIQ